MIEHIHFRCPCCHGSQYRTSQFDVTEKNPFGAKCIFCKSAMMTLDTIRPHHLGVHSAARHSNKMMKPVNAGGEISPVIRPGATSVPSPAAIVGGMA